MKFDLPTGKPQSQSQSRRKSSRLAPLVALAILTFSLYFIAIWYYSKHVYEPTETTHFEASVVELDDDETCAIGFRRCREGEKGDHGRGKEEAKKEPERFKFDEEEEEAMMMPEKLEIEATKKPEKPEFETEQGTIEKPKNPDLAIIEQEAIQKLEDAKPHLLEQDAIQKPEDAKPDVLEQDAIQKPEDAKPDVLEQDAIQKPEAAKPDVLEQDAIQKLEDAKPDVLEQDAIQKLEGAKPDVLEQDAIQKLEGAKPDVLEHDAIQKLEGAKPDVLEQDAIQKLEGAKPDILEQDAIQKLEDAKLDVKKEQPTNKNDEHSTNNKRGNAKKKLRKPKKAIKNNKNSTVQENNPMPGMPVGTFRGNTERLIVRSRLLDEGQCDIFSGEWVPKPEGEAYTNETCYLIQEHQNCIKFGRPDREFLKWMWKPDNCELALFDPEKFLELVRGKSIAFVGDSIARNHMQSLVCLLSRVALPVDVSKSKDENHRYEYPKYDFNVSMFWSPFLIRTELTVPNDDKRPFRLYLDEPDAEWTNKIALFDYVIISAGHWFFRPTYFYVNAKLVGCLYCPETNVNHLTTQFSYRRAFRTTLQAINDEEGYHGTTFLRTFAPSHFEGAAWDNGGDCTRTRPYTREETAMEDYTGQMYLVQLEELRIAQKAGRRKGRRFVLLDATEVMQLRADGHPSRYGRLQTEENLKLPNDCVHWCLPGPIDAWNDFLQELLRREVKG